MNFFPKINRWTIPTNALEQSIADMAADGRNGNEGTCFWLGQRGRAEAEISDVFFLRGGGVRKSPRNVRVSAELMREVHERAQELGLILLGQIHSHSALCGVDMSASDHAFGISVPFFLSIICPNYAQNPMTTIRECGVHVFLPGKGYVRLSEEQVERKMLFVPGQMARTSIIGEKA